MIDPQEFFSLLSDKTRLRSLLLLHRKEEICVCEFTSIFGCIQPKVSRHLSLLRKAGIVLDERRGQWVYYRLNPSLEQWAKNLLVTTLKNIGNQKPYIFDFKKLASIHNLNCGLSSSDLEEVSPQILG